MLSLVLVFASQLVLTDAAPVVPRPKAALQGAAVARVVGAREKVLIEDARKFRFAAVAGLPLLRADTLHVPPEGFVLVEVLKNGAVVRVDEDLELPVADLALLEAPRQTATLASQVERLLTKEERLGLSERMIGWYVSPTAANVPSVRAEREQQEEEKRKESGPGSPAGGSFNAQGARTSSGPASAPGGGSFNAKVAAAPDELMESEAPEPSKKRSPPPGGARPPASKSASPAPPPAPPAAMAFAERSEPLPELAVADEAPSLARPGESAAKPAAPAPLGSTPDPMAGLSACLSAELDALGPAVRAKVGPVLRLRVRLLNGQLGLSLEGALPVPACARSWFEAPGHLPRQAVGAWTHLDVPLR